MTSISKFLRIQAAQGRPFGDPRAPALNAGTREQWYQFVSATHVASGCLGENPREVDAALKTHDPRYRAAYQTPEFR